MNERRQLLYLVGLAVAGMVACGDTRRDPPADAVGSGAAGQTTVVDAPRPPDSHLISASGIGAIRLGMTLDDARRALSTASFMRTSDGEGVALVGVTLEDGGTIVLYAEEDDASDPIQWSKQITMIETFDPAFRTAEGVHAGSPVTDVESVYGKVTRIVRSEIESREYVEFENQPANLDFRLDYTGIFSSGSSETTEFEPGGEIYSVIVSSY